MFSREKETMTEISTSAREAAERYATHIEGDLSIIYRDEEDAWLAGYQARDSEGKGEAGEGVFQKAINEMTDVIEALEDAKTVALNRRDAFKEMRDYPPAAPPAPKDERVAARAELFKAILNNLEEIGVEDTVAWIKSRGAFEIRAFEGGERA